MLLCILLSITIFCFKPDSISYDFVQEASRKNLKSGSTANVVLIADGHILASNVGDSKSLLCSESPHPPELKGWQIPFFDFLVHGISGFLLFCRKKIVIVTRLIQSFYLRNYNPDFFSYRSRCKVKKTN